MYESGQIENCTHHVQSKIYLHLGNIQIKFCDREKSYYLRGEFNKKNNNNNNVLL